MKPLKKKNAKLSKADWDASFQYMLSIGFTQAQVEEVLGKTYKNNKTRQEQAENTKTFLQNLH